MGRWGEVRIRPLQLATILALTEAATPQGEAQRSPIVMPDTPYAPPFDYGSKHARKERRKRKKRNNRRRTRATGKRPSAWNSEQAGPPKQLGGSEQGKE